MRSTYCVMLDLGQLKTLGKSTNKFGELLASLAKMDGFITAKDPNDDLANDKVFKNQYFIASGLITKPNQAVKACGQLGQLKKNASLKIVIPPQHILLELDRECMFARSNEPDPLYTLNGQAFAACFNDQQLVNFLTLLTEQERYTQAGATLAHTLNIPQDIIQSAYLNTHPQEALSIEFKGPRPAPPSNDQPGSHLI